ncbi:ICE-like protease (Caspase) p20 domain protein [Mycena sanguinolenta]|uniref:ICE-like protease (Caspase) p20 domain protein n=1 Tax=Mycena sanguinolenta TaxID=230812 RepID=A0A8H7D0A9_9AGAR|nr:ICE-like protease (Caspase) p20 domain protein [Mycena sanguinolenta]
MSDSTNGVEINSLHEATLEKLPPPSNNSRTNMFAAVIGINEYTEILPLDGAVNDARAVKKFLVDDLHVPLHHIVLLEDGAATRAKILSTLQTHFLDNPDIPDNGKATMVLYFAGHGSRIDAPEAILAPEGRIEMLCPVDYKTKDAAGEEIQAIPDYVLSRFLGEIVEKKSRNIIVILDCCHSGAFCTALCALLDFTTGGMDRDVDKTARSVRSDSYIPVDLDRRIWQDKGGAVPYREKSLSPCVLLAACGADEKAREFTRPDGTVGGRFTSELVPLLQQAPLECITPMELISQAEFKDLPSQNPRCTGSRSNWPFLNGDRRPTGMLLTPQKRLSPTESPNSSQKFRVEVGSLFGVLPGTEFKAYTPNEEYLCTLVAQRVRDDHSILVGKDMNPVDIPRWSRAVVSDWKSPSLRIHIPDDFAHAADLFTVPAGRPQKFVEASTMEDADIMVRSEGDEIVIGFVKSERESRIALPENPTHLPEVVEGVVRFNYFMDCANQIDRIEGVGLEMHQLKGEYPGCKPDPQNGNLIKEGKVQLVSNRDAKYGFTIRNGSSDKVFPYLFYLDPEMYTIEQLFSPAWAPVPLRSGKTVTLGMGSDRAFQFEVPPGKLLSSGYLKLLVTNEYIDLDWMRQDLSPFDPQFQGSGRVRPLQEPLDTLSTSWDAATVELTIIAAGEL